MVTATTPFLHLFPFINNFCMIKSVDFYVRFSSNIPVLKLFIDLFQPDICWISTENLFDWAVERINCTLSLIIMEYLIDNNLYTGTKASKWKRTSSMPSTTFYISYTIRLPVFFLISVCVCRTFYPDCFSLFLHSKNSDK